MQTRAEMSDAIDSKSDWKAYWQLRSSRDAGASSGEVGVESSAELAAHWRSVLNPAPDGWVLDLGCGAGAVSEHASAAGCGALIGLDISIDAVAVTRARVPDVIGIVASADALPFADQSISMVVSQFGFEYSDRLRAASEIARILKPGGVFHAVAHVKSGKIEAECQTYLDRVAAIERSQYIPAVREFFAAVFAFERSPSPALRTRMDAAFKTFADRRTTLMPDIQAGGIAGHLHQEVHQFYQNRRNYQEQTIVDWLDSRTAEISAYAGRMSSMLDAAIDADQAADVVARIAPDGEHRVAAFEIDGQQAGWRLTAQT